MGKGTASIGVAAWTYYFFKNKELENGFRNGRILGIWERFGRDLGKRIFNMKVV